MSKVDELVINYAIYEDAVEYLGTTEVTLAQALREISKKSLSVT